MKKNILYMALLAVGLMTFTSCDERTRHRKARQLG